MNKAFVVVDLCYGDTFKAGVVDFLTRKYNSNLTIRHSGSCQCGHNLVTEDGKHHLFSQFGAGMIAGSRTLLSKYVLINPLSLLAEEKCLSQLVDNPFEKLYIDEEAVVITPFHKSVNRLLEIKKGKSKEGSCGFGVWEARLDSINNPNKCLRVKDFKDNNIDILMDRLNKCKERMLNKLSINNITPSSTDDNSFCFFIPIVNILYAYLNVLKRVNVINTTQVNELINNSVNSVWESNQGIGLDDIYGFFPYVTANDTTGANAYQMLHDCNFQGSITTFGLSRTYSTRHGVGPFVTEDKFLNTILSDKYNITNPWQDNFRFGWLDLNLLRYSLDVNKNIDYLAISHIDELEKLDKWKVCFYYKDNDTGQNWRLEKIDNTNIGLQELLTKRLLNSSPVYKEYRKEEILSIIEQELEKKIKIKSFGPKSNDKQWID